MEDQEEHCDQQEEEKENLKIKEEHDGEVEKEEDGIVAVDETTDPTLQVSVDDDPPDDGDDHHQTGPTLQVAFQQNTDEMEEEDEIVMVAHDIGVNEAGDQNKKRTSAESTNTDGNTRDEEELLLNSKTEHEDVNDPEIIADIKAIRENTPQTNLELAMSNVLNRKEQHIEKLRNEILKLKRFIAKRKQTYKRKRKDSGAPTRALSAYNIFIQDKFAELSKKNDDALKSTDTSAQLERVPPASLVASTGGAWKTLPEEEKAKYEARAKADRKRYEEQMAKYQPPDKQTNRKRNKTGYNMFFSAHVLRLKQSEMGVPSERGSVARLVGTAWKQLSAEEKQYYEREADKHNGMNPVEKNVVGLDEDEDVDDEDVAKTTTTNRQQEHREQHSAAVQRQQQQAAQDPYAAHVAAHYAGPEMAAAGGAAYLTHPGMHSAAQHDPRAAAAAAAHHQYYYAQHHPAAYHYDYGGHHQQHNRASRQQAYQQYPQQTHAYGEYK